MELCFRGTPPGGVYCISRNVVNCAGGCAGLMFFFFRRFSAQAPASQIPSWSKSAWSSSVSEMAEFTKFDDAQVSGQPPISEELMTLLTAATVHKSILDGFRAPGIATCGRFSSFADDLPDFREALAEMFNVDKKHGPLHRLEASWWRFGNRQKLGRKHSERLSRQQEHTECLLSSLQVPGGTS